MEKIVDGLGLHATRGRTQVQTELWLHIATIPARAYERLSSVNRMLRLTRDGSQQQIDFTAQKKHELSNMKTS
jgi:hypothetical protein